jgi:hypothetical protein
MKNQISTPGFLWPLLALICVVVILIGLYTALRRTDWSRSAGTKWFAGIAISIVAWIAILVILAGKGFFAHFEKIPPRPALAILIPLPFVLIFAFSKRGTQLLESMPKQWPIYMQSFRIFVELLIWFAFLSGKLPVQMTAEGLNFDLLTGLFAFPVGYLCFRKKTWPKGVAVAYNILGILLLVNVLVIAMLSMPTSFRVFMNEPSTELVARIPFILLPGVLVPIAYSMHIISLRQLLHKKKDDSGFVE